MRILISVIWLLSGHSYGENASLSLADYLLQVKASNDAFKARARYVEGYGLASEGGDLLTQPNFFAEAKHSSQKDPPYVEGLPEQKTSAQSYALGISQATAYGLRGKLSYQLSSVKTEGVINPNQSFLNGKRFYEASPTLELSQSLWKNAFGREIQASQNMLAAEANLKKYEEKTKLKQMLLRAEMLYWHASLSKEILKVQEDTYARAEKIRDLSLQRTRNELGDKSDLLQAQATLELRGLELQLAKEELANAQRDFNSMRGKKSEQIEETLQRISQGLSESLPASNQNFALEAQDNVRLAEEMKNLAQAGETLSVEQYRPDVEVFGQMSWRGRDEKMSPAQSDSFSSDYPASAVGLRLNVPLGISRIQKSNLAAKLKSEGASKDLERIKFETSLVWQDLNRRLSESRKRLDLVTHIEAAQKQKIEHERIRHRNGRSTIFQVLQYENDYASAQLNRIKVEAEILSLGAEIKNMLPEG